MFQAAASFRQSCPPVAATWTDLKAHFKAAGVAVNRVEVPENDRGRGRGYAIVEVASKKDVKKAIDELHDSTFDGRKLVVREDREDGAAPSGGAGAAAPAGSGRGRLPKGETRTKVRVKNLPFDLTWKELKDAFGAVAKVVRAEIAETAAGKSKGWGTVDFATPADAWKAIQEMNLGLINNREITVAYDSNE